MPTVAERKQNTKATRYAALLCCPVCQSEVQSAGQTIACTNLTCGAVFPVVDGIPVLINEAHSVFSISDFTNRRSTTDTPLPGLVRWVMRLLPEISHNLVGKKNYKRYARLLLGRNPHPRVLVVGGGAVGEGMTALQDYPAIELSETDVYFGDRTAIICDAHDLPFKSGSFDGVIIQAVLEHVADPYRCVEEIHRVLKPEGLVYAETPFMQQVHLGPYDFTRFTHLGHRRLFGRFEEITSGPLAGPGMVLAWSIEYFLLGFARSMPARMLVRGLVRLLFFWVKYFDYYLLDKPGAYDGASGHYFMGKKRDSRIADRELIGLYRGAIR